LTSALLSRLRVWRLEALTDAEVATVVERALGDPERGLAGKLGPSGGVAVEPAAFDHLVSLAGGDARAALNVLEGAVALAEAENARDERGRISPRLTDVEAAAQQRVLGYDRAGDGHYDTVSAFIKSIRGNDPDAALYWLATMIAAGEDPRFIARRLIIAASEDVGNADPRGLQVAVAASQALDWVGLPEAQYALAQATILLAVMPKSDAVGRAYFAALDDVVRHGSLPIPNHLRSAGDRRLRHHGIGVGYRNPHEFGGDVEQQYLPDRLAGTRYWHPTDEGQEASLAARQRERLDARPARRRVDRPGPSVDPMRASTSAMRQREGRRREIAESQQDDANDRA
jgi:putative ATPase